MFHVLIVDDDRLVRTALTRTLARHAQLHVHEFSIAAEALVRAAELTFAVAVLDLQMPVLDGVTLGTQLRAIQPNLPLVFVSANTGSDLAERARLLPMQTLVSKPWNAQELIDVVLGYCNQTP